MNLMSSAAAAAEHQFYGLTGTAIFGNQAEWICFKRSLSRFCSLASWNASQTREVETIVAMSCCS
jgi:hypothetical protein